MSWRDLKGIAREFMQKYNQRGQEVPDPTPVEVPFKWRRPKDIHEMIAEAVQSHEIQRKWNEEGRESWDEANDFDVGDEDIKSPYELSEMQEEYFNVSQSERKKKVVDRKNDKKENKGTVNSDRLKESADGKRENGEGGQSEDRRSVERNGKSINAESE